MFALSIYSDAEKLCVEGLPSGCRSGRCTQNRRGVCFHQKNIEKIGLFFNSEDSPALASQDIDTAAFQAIFEGADGFQMFSTSSDFSICSIQTLLQVFDLYG